MTTTPTGDTDTPTAPALDALLPAVLDPSAGDGDEATVTDALLDHVDIADNLTRLVGGLTDLLAAATAPATRRAYTTDWADFTSWTHTHRLDPLPAAPLTVALYLQDRADTLAVSSLLRRLSAIALRHREAHADDPTRDELVRRAVAGLRRTRRTRPTGKRALVTAQLTTIATRLDARTRTPPPATGGGVRADGRAARRYNKTVLAAYRDRALLLLGYAAALRRSELVALTIGDVTAVDSDGLKIFIAHSKTDQTGLGAFVGVAHGHPAGTCTASCPVQAVTDWTYALADTLGLLDPTRLPAEGPLFRPIDRHGRLGSPTTGPDTPLSGRSVARIVQAAVALLDDPDRFPPAAFGAHSLRAGFVTQAGLTRIPIETVMRQTRHRSMATAMGYYRPASIFHNNPSAQLGL